MILYDMDVINIVVGLAIVPFGAYLLLPIIFRILLITDIDMSTL